LVLGTQERFYKTRDFFYYYHQLCRSFARFQTCWSVGRVPDHWLDCGRGRRETAAERRLEATDHLNRVAGIIRGQVKRLEENGNTRLTALAAADRRSGRAVASIPPTGRLCAPLQFASRAGSATLGAARDSIQPAAFRRSSCPDLA
jgi:predicted RecB family nuclease